MNEDEVLENSLKKADEYILDWYKKEESDILLLLGEPGHGKSSFCKKMIYDYVCNKTMPKMFYFSLNPNHSSIIENNRFNLENVFQIKKGKILNLEDLKDSIVFLDGFDELFMSLQETDCKDINHFINIIKQYIYENNFKVVITSRKSCINTNDKKLFRQVKIISLANLIESQHKDWIKTYNKLVNNKYDINKLKKMYANKQISELIQIPILFELIVDNDINLNIQNQIELYHNIFDETIIYREHEVVNNIREDAIQTELEQIAFSIFRDTDKYTYMNKNDLKKNNSTKLRAIISFYLKNSTNSDMHVIEFIHRSFYQYFLAYYIYHSIENIVKNKTILNIQLFLNNLYYRRLDKDTLNFVEQISEFEEYSFTDDDIQLTLEQIENMDSWCICNSSKDMKDYKLFDEDIKRPYMKQTIILSNILSILCYLKKGLNDYLNISKRERLIELLRLFETKGDFPNIKISSDEYIDLKGADLSLADLNDADLSGVDLSRADLSLADLNNTDLKGTDLSRAYLNNADLINVDLSNADLTGADLTGADLRGAHLNRTKLKGAVLINTKISRKDLIRIDPNEVDLIKAIIYE